MPAHNHYITQNDVHSLWMCKHLKRIPPSIDLPEKKVILHVGATNLGKVYIRQIIRFLSQNRRGMVSPSRSERCLQLLFRI